MIAKNGRWYLEGGGWETLGEGPQTKGRPFEPGDRIKVNVRLEDLQGCADEDGWVQFYVSRRPEVDEYAGYTHSLYFKEPRRDR